MTREQHIERHELLHKMFDELVADYLVWNPGKVPSNTTMLEIMAWSFRQTKEPSEPEVSLGPD